MKYFLAVILNMLFSLEVAGQKEVSRIYEAGNIKQLEIYADEVFDIKIKTTGNDRLVITSVSEGEYYNDIWLNVEVLQEKIILSSRFPENLQEGYDKLSAHKVFSVELVLEIPEGIKVYLESNIAAVTATGKFDDLQVQLRSGSCKLLNFEGNAVVNTYNGSIDISAKDFTVEAVSRTGKVDFSPKISGKYHLKLQSGTGNIRVREN